MKSFVIYWNDGTYDIIKGESFITAFKNAGYKFFSLLLMERHREESAPSLKWNNGIWEK